MLGTGLALWVSLAVCGPQPARADDRTSVEAGRADARAVLILGDPRACGIALLRERCIADIEAFLRGRGDGDFAHVPKVGPHPASGLRAFVSNGDRDAFDTALSWINYRQATEAQWKADPRDAARYDAGVLDVFMAGTNSELAEMLGAAPGADLALHAGQVPAGALPIDIAPLRDLHMTRPNSLRVLPFVRDLVRAVRASVPPPALDGIPGTDGAAADAALGVAVVTMAELIGARWATQNDSQGFAAALADRLDAIVPAPGRPAVATFRTKIRAGPSFDGASANEALTAALAVFDAAVARDRAVRVKLASVAAQLAYNSAIVRSADASSNMLTVLAGSDALDAAIPGWKAARSGGASIGASDWLTQHAYALRLVDLIEKANHS